MKGVVKTDIEGFFNNMKTVLVDKEVTPTENSPLKGQPGLVRSVDDKEGTTRTNVVYLNTDCNLRCEYCYEKDSREGLADQANCTEEQIDSFLYEIKDREKDHNSCIVVMGGEPLLKFNLLEHLIRKAMSIEKKGGWAIPVTTNGMMFLSKSLIAKYKILLNDIEKCPHVIHDIEVSFDVSGQYRRKMPDGSNSRPYVEHAIRNIIKENFPMKLSYTVHKGNYKNLLEDIVYLLETYPQAKRIAMSWALQELDDELGDGQCFVVKKNFKPYAKHLFERYNIPICGLVCSVCKQCNKNTSVGNAYLSPTEGILYADKRTEKTFNQF